MQACVYIHTHDDNVGFLSKITFRFLSLPLIRIRSSRSSLSHKRANFAEQKLIYFSVIFDVEVTLIGANLVFKKKRISFSPPQ